MYDQDVMCSVIVRTMSWSGRFSMVVTCHTDAVSMTIRLCTRLLQKHHSTSYHVQMVHPQRREWLKLERMGRSKLCQRHDVRAWH